MPSPADPQSLNRFAYTRNNPLRYTDPTGHYTDAEIVKIFGVNNYDAVIKQFEKGGKFDGKWGFLNLLHAAKNGDNVYFLGNTPSMGDGTIEFSGSYNFNFDGKGLLAPGQVSREGNACYLFPEALAGQVNGSTNGYLYEAISSQGDVLGQLYYAAGQKANRPDSEKAAWAFASLIFDVGAAILGDEMIAPSAAAHGVWMAGKTAVDVRSTYNAAMQDALIVGNLKQGKIPSSSSLLEAGFDTAALGFTPAAIVKDIYDLGSAFINTKP